LLAAVDLYKWRHLIENFFAKLKEFKRIAMRADKTDNSFKSAIYLAAAIIHSRRISTDPSLGIAVRLLQTRELLRAKQHTCDTILLRRIVTFS
jgi:hypothetical protein